MFQLTKELEMKIKTFEDLQVWKDAIKFVRSIYELNSTTRFTKDYGLKDQIQRAAVSIMNKIAEDFERDSNKGFIKFPGYSKGSAGEIRSIRYVALDLNYITKSDFEKNYNNSISIIKQISNFKKYLRNYAMKEKLSKVKVILLQILIP